MAKSGKTGMTEGSPARLIFLFTIPLFLGNMLQQLYNMVDSIVVGKFVGKTALAAVGTGFPIIFLLAALFMGLSMGSSVLISQYYGAKNFQKVQDVIDTSYTLLIVLAVPLSIVGFFVSTPLLQFIQVPADTLEQASVYLRIIFIGLLGFMGYNTNAGILRGLGDSRTPLIFLAIASLMNIVLDLVFVLAFHWDVAGVAIATIISQAFSWLFGIYYVNKYMPEIHMNPLSFRFDKDLFRAILRIGLPSGLQQMLFSLGIMMLQSLVNSFGSDFMAGFNAASKVDTFAFMPIQSFFMAATTYTGQNIGAQRLDRVKEGTKVILLMAVGFAVFAGLLLSVIGRYALGLFTNDAVVINSGMAYLSRITPFYWMLAIMFMLNGIMRGAGAVLVPTISSIAALWLGRVPAAYLLAHFAGRDNMYFCYVIGWAIGLAVVLPYFLSGKWKELSLIKQKKRAEAMEAEVSADLDTPDIM